MALQNRVTPEGEIIATPERGLLMGNRGGQMHDGDRRLTGRRWVSKAWITCLLEYKDWREPIMKPGRYTQLFFLDEATAFAAGHRPCALCRRADFNRFMVYFAAVQGWSQPPRVGPVDEILHEERLTERRTKRTMRLSFDDLPDGVLVRDAGQPKLLLGGHLHPWSPGGYGAPERATGGSAEALTPPSIIAILRAGYAAMIHPTCASRRDER